MTTTRKGETRIAHTYVRRGELNRLHGRIDRGFTAVNRRLDLMNAATVALTADVAALKATPGPRRSALAALGGALSTVVLGTLHAWHWVARVTLGRLGRGDV